MKQTIVLQKPHNWLLMVVFFLLVFQFGVQKIFHISEEAAKESAKLVLEKRVNFDLIRIKNFLSPTNFLTRIWQESINTVGDTNTPEQWYKCVSEKLSSMIGSSAFSLVVFCGKKEISESDSWNRDPLKKCLDFQLDRFNSFQDASQAANFFIQNKELIHSDGNSSFLNFDFIYLPTPPGIFSPSLMKINKPDLVFLLDETYRNTWATLGSKTYPGFSMTYICLFHSKGLSAEVISQNTVNECKKLGINLRKKNDSNSFQDEGNTEMISEKIPGYSDITLFAEIPKNLIPRIFHIANYFLSVLLILICFLLFHRKNWENSRVYSKIGIVILISAGFPFYFLLIAIQGQRFHEISQNIQSIFSEEEKEIRQFEREFGIFLEGMENHYKKTLPALFESIKEGDPTSISNDLLFRLKALHLNVISSGTNFLLPMKAGIDWTAWFIRRLPPEKQKEAFLSKCKEGHIFELEDIQFLLNDNFTKQVTDKLLSQEAPNFLFHHRNLGSQIKTLTKLTPVAIDISNDKEGIPTQENELTKGVILDVFIGGELYKELKSQLQLMGRFLEIKNLDYFGISHPIFFPEIFREKDRPAHSLFWAMHDYNFIVEDFLSKIISKPDLFRKSQYSIIPRWSSAFSINENDQLSGPQFFSEASNQMGALSQWIEPDHAGKPYLVSGIFSNSIKDVVIIAARPLSDLTESYLPIQRMLGLLGAGILIFLVLGKIFLTPLKEFQSSLENERNSHFLSNLNPDKSWAIGEFSELSELFDEYLRHLNDLEIAKVVQNTLFSKNRIELNSWQCYGKTEMMSQVGGDFFDIIPLPDDKILFAFGDVSGHGVSAAIVVAMAKSAVSIFANQGLEPDQILDRMNLLLLDLLDRNKMMTLFIGILGNGGKIRFSNAGQTYPVILSHTTEAKFLDLTGSPLGITKKKSFETIEINLEPNEYLTFYSDGFPEALDENQQALGYENLPGILKNSLRDPLNEFLDSIFAEIRKFTGPKPWTDDVSLFAIKFAPETKLSSQNLTMTKLTK
ncbi:MAG: serine/threonine-protein phosphatase [Candidatus Riflebacteria bacterium]|nr:serine/threonine-protein phosphatase [Candidatus Riflebacteria bacterium]